MVDGQVLGGMAAAAAAAACFDGAVILQAQETRQVDPAHGLRLSLLARLVRRPRWVAGTALAVLGWPLQLLALALAPVTVVQPTLALGLVLLLAVGARVLDEPVGPREWAGAAAVVVGVGVLAAAAPAHTDTLPGPAAVAFAGGGLALVIALPFVSARGRTEAWSLIAAAGCAFALSALTGKLLTVELAAGRPLAALAWAVATAACAGVGFLVDQTAMQRFDATRVAPPMFVLETALPVVLAPLLFDERWGPILGRGGLVVVGLLLVLAGGAVLGAVRVPATGGGSQDSASARTASAALGSSP
jgi:drug/metabolite transporter (DMT)-like permease